MKEKIIQTENYLLVGNDNNSKRGWFYCFRTKNLFQDEGEDVLCCNGDMNIVAHLPLNNSPILDGVDLLPPLKDEIEDVNKLVINEWVNNDNRTGVPPYMYEIGFIEGYKKAKEKYKYTEDDVIYLLNKTAYKYFYEGKEYKGNMAIGGNPLYGVRRELIDMVQSLQQPKMPVGFECEMANCDNCVYVQGGNLSPDCCNQLKLKTTTNSQGLTQWIGKYIY